MIVRFPLLLLFLGLCLPGVCAGELTLPSPLPDHPRLLASADDWSRLREQIHADPASAALFASLEAQGAKALKAPLPVRTLTGKRMLRVSRSVLSHTLSLSLLYQITGQRKYAERATAEMLAACEFEDWHPQHFLDTAEMALGVAIGYDWLYGELTPPQREQIARALREKALEPSLGKQWWISGKNNWTQVCHSGLSAAAIAIADSQPELATTILNRAIVNVVRCAKSYAPDGVFPEGPMYWDYATSFHVILAAALERFTGSAHGLDTLPGFEKTPLYLLQVTTPTGGFFNYSDCGPGTHLALPLTWFARHFHQPQWAAISARKIMQATPLQRSRERLMGLALLWHAPALASPPQPGALPPIWLGRGNNPLAVFRSSWETPDALYLGIKGGGPSYSHAHMDGGSFILEADGVRWALDPGMQNYQSIEQHGIKLFDLSQGSERWHLFRLGPEGHNILRFNGGPQRVEGDARFVRFQAEGPRPHAVVELTSLYGEPVRSAHRGVMFVNRRAVLFQDEWSAGAASLDVSWQMLTRAEVTIAPGRIILAQEGKTLTLKVLAPAHASIHVQEAATLQKPLDEDNPGLRRITIQTHTDANQSGALRILATPGTAGAVTPPPARALLQWSAPLQKPPRP